MNNYDNQKISSEKMDKLKNFLEENSININQLKTLYSSSEIDESILDTLEPIVIEDIDLNIDATINENEINNELVTTIEKEENRKIISYQVPKNEDIKDQDEELDLLSDEDEPLITIGIPFMPPLIKSMPSHFSFTKSFLPINHSLNSIISQHQTNKQSYEVDKKITLNVGGKKFKLKKNVLKNLEINYTRLHKIIKDDGKINYFLDRDPYYFSKIMEIIKICGFDEDHIASNIDTYSEQLLNEMCMYGLLGEKFSPEPKIKSPLEIKISSRHDDIIKIIVSDQIFETTENVLSRSKYFDTKIKLNKTKQFYLNDTDPKIFRYIINFLRIGKLYVNNSDIIDLLNNYGIEYYLLENKKIDEIIVSHYIPYSSDIVHDQLTGCANSLDPKNIPCQLMDNKYYYPSSTLVSPNTENFNIITTESQLLFGTDIFFNLTDTKRDLGECIEDLVLCIDIPIIDDDEKLQYVDNIEFQIIESIDVISILNSNKKLMFHSDNLLLYLYPIFYMENSQDYHEMSKVSNKKIKLLYNNTLIDIHRIILPLFLFSDGQTHLPVRKMLNNKNFAYLIVKMAPIKKLFKDKIKEIPLLNVTLISNYINLASNISIHHEYPHQDKKQKQSKILQIPINEELKNSSMMYLYDKTHSVTLPIKSSNNQIFDIVVIPLDNFGYIKDLFFVIIDKNNFVENRIDIFADALIEMEILQTSHQENSEKQKTVTLYGKFDSLMLNYYVPLKRLGHKLPTGIYYYSFSPNPKCCQMLGGLQGTGYFVRLKIKKMDGVVRFYANEYNNEFL